jgi:Trk K+ transport system NAD-binding subunit
MGVFIKYFVEVRFVSKVVVVGGGWLGQPLAEFLIGFGHSFDISKTTDEGVFELRNKRLNGF